MKKWIKLVLLSTAISMCFSSYSSAISFNILGGQLLGALNVDVNGTDYDVEFFDGSYEDLYNDSSSVIFDSGTEAGYAANALRDQVFVDGTDGLFDSNPELTNGIEGAVGHFRFFNNAFGTHVNITTFSNYGSNHEDPIGGFSIYTSNDWWDYDWSTSDIHYGDLVVLAKWALSSQTQGPTSGPTPAPEPSTMLLLGAGLAGLTIYRRKVKK